MGIKLKDIAIAAGVSEGTASLAVNGRPGVKEETKKRILAIASEMGYVPSANAKSLAEKKSGLIGVLVPNISNLFYSALVSRLESILRQMGYQMIMATTESNEEYEKRIVEQFVSFRVEGAIIYPSIKENQHPDYLNVLKLNGIPLVFIGSYYPDIQVPHIMSDLYSGVYQATEYLYQTGCRSFYYIGGCKTIISNRLKIMAIADALKEKGIVFSDERYIELPHTRYEYAYEAFKKVITQMPMPDAVIAADAFTGLAVYKQLMEHNISVPQQVSIVNFDNLLRPEICVVQMSCIEQDVEEIVRNTIQILFRQIHGEPQENCLIATKMILRETTK